MQALICTELEGIDSLRLEDIPTPTPGPGEVLIEVKAAGMNFADTLMCAGKYQVKPPLPFVPGLELAGVIAAIGPGVSGPGVSGPGVSGPGVSGFEIGQRVMAVVDCGAFAEQAVCLARNVCPIPAGLDFHQAAGFQIAYSTAYGALIWKARLQPGETLLVHGAAGGVGLTAVEIGKALGARVIATAGGADKCAIATAHGADAVIDYKAEDIRLRVKDLTDGKGADVVYDPVGGDVFDASLRCVNWNARLVIIGFASGDIPAIPANILLVKNIDVLGFYLGSYRHHRPEMMVEAFAALGKMVGAGQLRPHISEILPLAAWRKAFDMLLTRRSTGKIVLVP